ncbi:hypothetical protein C2E21_2295 [Chlorella sorokiniana]|uniref:Uncharacterized protein n=1 Tax=Chlorella sorokiniana TaxID=3076 RepID=A0A2P6TZ13_CHLSO|nr:hypothetical protein C2E21_2295 [Chlorella sorokiniana]|eukprot:PRW59305.1 hypothetical protein C2E21_2295 [Chlorella sorokiniana]
MSESAPQPSTSAPAAAPPAAASSGSARSSGCPPHVLEAIYGKQTNKKEQLERSLHRWWTEYADRKNDEDEYVADSLLYDRRHLPRTAPAPECVARIAAEEAAAAAAAAADQQQGQQGQGAAGQAAQQQQPAAAAAQQPAAASP